jgi:hypothetical protein
MAAVQPPQPLQADFQEFHWIRTGPFPAGSRRALAGRVQSKSVVWQHRWIAATGRRPCPDDGGEEPEHAT